MAVNFPVYQPPDISGSFAQGQQDATRAAEAPLTLANMLDEQKMSKLTLANAEKQSKDQAQVKSILKGVDYSSTEGLADAASKLSRAGYGTESMNLLRFGQEYSSGQHQERVNKLEETSKQQGRIATELDIATAQLDAMKAAGADPKALDVQAAQIVDKVLPQLKQDHPELAQQIDQWAKNPGLRTYAGLKKFEQISNQSTALLTKQIEAARLSLAERKENFDEGAKRAQLGQGQERIQIERDKMGMLTRASTDSLAEQYMTGDEASLQGLQPRDKIKVRNRVSDLQQIRGLTGADQAAAAAQFGGVKAGEHALGTRQANIDTAVTEAQRIEPILRETSDKVWRSGITGWNKLLQMYETGGVSDPDTLAFLQAAKSFANLYTRATVPGASSVTDREEAIKHLPTFAGPEAFNRVLDVMKQEMEAAKESPAAVREDMARAITNRKAPPSPGQSATPAPPPQGSASVAPPASGAASRAQAAGGGPTPPAGVPVTNAQGWTLHQDKIGRWAYVSPDGSHFQRVQ